MPAPAKIIANFHFCANRIGHKNLQDKKWDSYRESGSLTKNTIPVVAKIIDIFLPPLPPFESKKMRRTSRYSEREINIILATIVTICWGYFLFQKGERGKFIISAMTGITFSAKSPLFP